MLHYWVVLPKSFKPVELKLAALPDIGLTYSGRYLARNDSPCLEVWAVYERCHWEMNASDWLFKSLP